MQTMRWIGGSSVVPILCVLAIAGSALYSLLAPTPRTVLDDLVGLKKQSVTGLVVADPDRRATTAFLDLKVDGIKAHVRVSVDPYTTIAYGDRITATGTLKYPEAFDTDTGRTFDYPHYLRAKGILYTVSFAEITTLERGKGNVVIAKLLDLKHWFERGMKAALPSPESDLLGGLLIGSNTLNATTTAEFRNAGVVHIIVLSGYNVSLVMNSVVYVAASVLPRVATYGVASIFIILFAIMTGASETTVRATVMALIMILATVLNRPKAALRVLLIAAAAMAVYDPYLVLYDLSFQLSVLATLGLILFADPLMSRIKFIPQKFGLREIIATTLATQATVLPLLILSTGRVSTVFLITNPLILPAVPAAMLTGFVASLVALISPTLALPFSSLAYYVLTYIIHVATWFGSLPFASIIVPPF